MTELRSKVVQLYKHLIYLGREYPGTNGPEKFRQQVRDAFLKNKSETDPRKIKALLAQGRYVAKEVETLYYLKKYRAIKQRYTQE
ncbi:electron transfer flavoprotein regulatory factor 1 [Glossina fuscipes]|uniref:Electron transfer flavoprotein regulatory factor 1 n=2 Tax=Nemorhina TaxID=44051 RepID=A0A8U0WKY6_9MUSC|nr:electron transfer flavoprotein regulatory factor 1 [Glossina fuscipes]